MVSQKYINCCEWDENNIKGFFGWSENEFGWLSNFWPCKIVFKGLEFNSSEAAYMYGKLLKDDTLAQYEAIRDLKPWEVKKWGRQIELRPDWEQIKLDVMWEVLWDKFTRNEDLKEKLISTKDKYLEETVNWHDNCWGRCICSQCKGELGKNNLGRILMDIRNLLNKRKRSILG